MNNSMQIIKGCFLERQSEYESENIRVCGTVRKACALTLTVTDLFLVIFLPYNIHHVLQSHTVLSEKKTHFISSSL